LTRVGTYVQRGSKFCFVVVLLVLLVVVVGESLIKILHYCPISPCIQQPCPAALTGSLDRQFDQFRPDMMRSLGSHHTVLQWQVTKLHARAAVLTG
jgi:hypothetical protein